MSYKAKVLELAAGGTNAALTAANGGIFYSSATAAAILAPTSTANQPLLSGASGAPGWSTATYPGSTTINNILYSSANNTVAQITAANNGTLISGTTGVPSWLANGTTGQVLTATTGSPPSWGAAAGAGGGKVTAQRFTATGAFTYTPTANMVTCIIELISAGGGSGGVVGTAGVNVTVSEAGGGGSYLKIYATAAQIGASASGSVGTGGTAGASGNNAGGAGGNTTITIGGGTVWTAVGGSGGAGGGGGATSSATGAAANANTTGTNATLINNITGSAGGYSYANAAFAYSFAGDGGSSPGGYGFGGKGGKTLTTGQQIGLIGSGVGAGGGASSTYNTTGNLAGVAGTNGYCVVTEFLSG